MSEQSVIFTITEKSVEIQFSPPLCAKEEFEKLPVAAKMMQNKAAAVANQVMSALNKN
jgi:hypothetical protein